MFLNKFDYVPAMGTTGGIIIGWNSSSLTRHTIKVGVYSLTVEFFSVQENLTWRYTTVYGPNEHSLKQVFWEELKTCRGPPNLPWVICGDFNAIFSLEDKSSGPQNLVDIRSANDFLHEMNLIELPTVGKRFIWTNC